MVFVSAATNSIQDIWAPGDDSTRISSDYRDYSYSQMYTKISENQQKYLERITFSINTTVCLL